MHFVKHPHLRPARISPPPEPPRLIEHFRRNWPWYGVVCVTMLAAIVLSSVYLASH
jgi:hypothetical protein